MTALLGRKKGKEKVSSRIFPVKHSNWKKNTFTNASVQWGTTAASANFEAFSMPLSDTSMNWKCGIAMLTSSLHLTVKTRFSSATSGCMSTHKRQRSNLVQKLALSEIDKTSQGKTTTVLTQFTSVTAMSYYHGNGCGHTYMQTAAGTHTCKRLRAHILYVPMNLQVNFSAQQQDSYIPNNERKNNNSPEHLVGAFSWSI